MKELFEEFVEEMQTLEFADDNCAFYDEQDVWDIINKYRERFNGEED